MSKDQSRTLHMVWLETLLMREGFRRAEEFFSSVREVRRPSQAILPVFFKQADACLTTRRSFDLACEMNPQVGMELMVLAQSPDLAGGVIVFRPTYEEKHKELMMEVLEKLEEDPQGKQLLKLFRMSRLHPFKPEYLMTVETLFRQHDTLRVALVKGK
jgi:phosphonate transport system substrate-binding protein